ncbi:MAG: hypothetical protein NZ826_03095, partial [Thermodesulfovibrio sp.]|nr:hypothetical protein [Thermodesulfovibrio sp.]
MQKFSIRWLFLIVMIVLLIVISASNYLFSYYFYKDFFKHHIETVSDLFHEGTEKIFKPIDVFLYNIDGLVCFRILNFYEVEKTNKLLMDFMKKHPYVTSINYGDERGNGYLILNDRGQWKNRIKKAEDKGYVIWNTLDSDGKIIKKIRVKDNYDPRETVWYKQALNSQDIQWSKEYILRTTRDPGITASINLCRNSKEVVGIDITIKDLSILINKLRDSLHPKVKLYLVSDGEYVIAHTDEILIEPEKIYKVDEKNFPLLFKSLNSQEKDSEIFLDTQRWFVKIKKWKNKNRDYSLVVFIPMTVFTEKFNQNLLYQLIISLLFTFLVFFYISREYLKPLMDFAKVLPEMGSRKIKFDKYSQRNDEIGYLSKAISDASVQILKAKEMERKIQEANHFESVKRSLGEAVHRFKDI